MNVVELFLDPKTNVTYFVGDNICYNCREDVFGSAIHVSLTCLEVEKIAPHKYNNSLILKTHLYCRNCAFKRKSMYDIVYWTEIRNVVVMSKNYLPDYSIPIVVKPNYDVKDGHNLQGVLNTWVADNNKGIKSDTSSVEIIDNTKLANKESWEGASIGARVEDSNKDKLLGLDEFDDTVKQIASSKPIKDDEKRLLR